ncbi:alcohol dehydrogenase catalytic domain-containing protein [Micromonospora schwarzwaldensis]|uniref:alcohol dehydrogenase catalytic domain-containing protein n=1 Tax=Micromonospora sp. DSM 45708 TaxID=3111767 RepID=UPI0031D7958D
MTGRTVLRSISADGRWWPVVVRRPVPPRPGPEWSLARVTMAGICGSDLRGLADHDTDGTCDSVVPGHEVVGVVEDGPLAGRRVVVHPLVPCAARAVDPCPACRAGRFGQCRSFWAPELRWGKSLGFSAALGGGWADRVWAHRTMLRPVPAAVPDRTAVLAEPLSVAVAGLREVRDTAATEVAVVGGGTVGLVTLVAAASVLPGRRLSAIVRHGFQADAVRALGAEPSIGPPELTLDGPALVVDAGGTSSSLVDAMRAVAAGGTVLTLGNPEDCADLTPLWLKGLTLVGHLEHSAHDVPPPALADSLDEAVRLLAATPDLGDLLVTHSFPPDDLVEALAVARSRETHRAIKVVLEHP